MPPHHPRVHFKEIEQNQLWRTQNTDNDWSISRKKGKRYHSDFWRSVSFTKYIVSAIIWRRKTFCDKDSWTTSVTLRSQTWISISSNNEPTWAMKFEPRHDKTNNMACVPSLIRVFDVRIKKSWVLSYPLSALRRLWSVWVHTHFVGFVMSWLI